MNKKHLKLHAGYLLSLPHDYQHFCMRPSECFNNDDDPALRHWSSSHGPSSIDWDKCKTVACSLGHAVYVNGLPKANHGRSWASYSRDLFGLNLNGAEWYWCFSKYWKDIDNTPQGAAKRILYLIDNPRLTKWDKNINLKAVGLYKNVQPTNQSTTGKQSMKVEEIRQRIEALDWHQSKFKFLNEALEYVEENRGKEIALRFKCEEGLEAGFERYLGFDLNPVVLMEALKNQIAHQEELSREITNKHEQS